MAVRIGNKEFEEKVLNSDLPVVVDFYSDSCIACKKLSPALGQAEEALEGRFHFYRVNTEFEEALTEKYRIMSRPTLVVWQAGQAVGRKSGALRPEELIQWLESLLNAQAL